MPRFHLPRAALISACLVVACGLSASQHHDSKKGLQVQMVDDAIALGVRHAAINVNLCQLAVAKDSPNADAMVVDGFVYEFNRHYAEALDRQIKPLLDHDVIVYLILLAYDTPNKIIARECIHPNFNPAAPGHIGAFNTVTPEGRGRLRASVTYLAKRYAPPTPTPKPGDTDSPTPPVHFIVGNEVNSHWYWYNMGEAKLEDVAREYECAVRICAQAAECVSPESRVYLSMDHHWNASVTPKQPLRSFGALPLLNEFARIARQHGDYAWHLAFHPYPENLFECRTWNDKSPINDISTPKITFKNIEFLNAFMKSPAMLHDGQPRRIILSEQGFNTAKTPDGELVQAAAFAYSYKKVETLDGIDAFILHRHVDHNKEGGLRLGLWTGDATNHPVKKKAIYDVFRDADTPAWKDAFKFALPIIGVSDWGEIK